MIDINGNAPLSVGTYGVGGTRLILHDGIKSFGRYKNSLWYTTTTSAGDHILYRNNREVIYYIYIYI